VIGAISKASRHDANEGECIAIEPIRVRGIEGARHRGGEASRGREYAYAKARGASDHDNQNLSEVSTRFEIKIKKNPIIMIFYFLDRI